MYFILARIPEWARVGKESVREVYTGIHFPKNPVDFRGQTFTIDYMMLGTRVRIITNENGG